MESMVHVAVVSDQPDTVGIIRKVCGEFMVSRGLALSFTAYENSYVFLQEVENRKKLFEIIFLDTSVRGRMGQMKEKLMDASPFLFISPCRGVLVNSEEIGETKPDRVVLKSGRILPVAKRKYEEFKLQLARYMGEED